MDYLLKSIESDYGGYSMNDFLEFKSNCHMYFNYQENDTEEFLEKWNSYLNCEEFSKMVMSMYDDDILSKDYEITENYFYCEKRGENYNFYSFGELQDMIYTDYDFEKLCDNIHETHKILWIDENVIEEVLEMFGNYDDEVIDNISCSSNEILKSMFKNTKYKITFDDVYQDAYISLKDEEQAVLRFEAVCAY